MSDEQRNFLLAGLLTLLVLIGWDYFFGGSSGTPTPQTGGEVVQQQKVETPALPDGKAAVRPSAPAAPSAGPAPEAQEGSLDRKEALARTPRVPIDTPRLSGSISLKGGLIDDLVLKDYRVSVERDAPNVVLLDPVGTKDAYFAAFGWSAPQGSGIETPGLETVWRTEDRVLSPGHPVRLTWTNRAGLVFTRTLAVDENFMFTITDTVRNPTGAPAILAPWGLVNRHGEPKVAGYYMMHEGPLGVFNDALVEKTYKDLKKDGDFRESTVSGWLGITDKYWLVAALPDQKVPFTGRFIRREGKAGPRYQTDFLAEQAVIPAGGERQFTTRLFAGAKEVDLIENYAELYQIKLFDRAIDWGWFIFLTKPIFYTLDWLYERTGSFAIAILLLTVLVKALFFPLANKSYHAMARMKAVQPKMKALQERYKDDKERLQREMMDLYRKEKVNPAAGCLPMLIQIPVFFALYKVLFVTIEMRHQPGLFWVKDLSAPDHLTVINLFGMIPWDPPNFLAIGVWPMIMGLVMFLQQRLNPPAGDPVQQKVMMAMPFFFMFIMARFPAGLVMYWTWNTILSGLQQWFIMRRDRLSRESGGTA